MLKEMRQLRMLTMEDINAQARANGMEPETGKSGLLDSGASHAFRAGSKEEVDSANRVRVQLATGDYVTLAQNRGGTLLATKSTDQDMACPIVPLGSLVQDLNCELTWGRRRGLEIVHPVHGVIRPKVVGQCPLVGEAQALQLIKELEDKRVDELQRSNILMQQTLWAWDKDLTRSRHVEMFIEKGDRVQQLKALEAEDSPFCSLPASMKGSMAEDVVLNDKAGWSYLKAVPISRRMRKRLMTTPWVVNLFSGHMDGCVHFKTFEDGAVLVEMDIVRSKAFDMRKPAGAYRALLWAAATGRVKGLMASPPMRATVDEELVAKAMWCSLAAKATRAHYIDTPAFVMFEGAKMMSYLKSRPEGKNPTGLQRAWPLFMDVMCLEYQYDVVATNLDYQGESITTSTTSGRWTDSFKERTVAAVDKWLREPESRQVSKWMAKMDAGSFLGSLSDRELEQWRIHVRNNHQPYNRKCRTCVESSGTGRKHVKIKTPSSYCLSLDMCGPFRQRGADPDHADYRFALIGAYVVPRMSHEVPEGGPHNDEVPEGGPHNHEVPEGGPHSHEVPEGGPHSHEVPEGGPHSDEVPEGGPHSHEVPEGGPHSHEVPEGGPHSHEVPEGGSSEDQRGVQIVGGDFDPEVEHDTGAGAGPLHGWSDGELLDSHEEQAITPEEERKLPKGMTEEEFKQVFSEVEGMEGYQVMYLSSPLRSRTTKDVLAAVQDLYLRLRSLGFPIVRVHLVHVNSGASH